MLESSRERRRFTPEEYLAIEERSETRSEFCDGELFAMTGGSLTHNRLINNLARHLGNALAGGPCVVFTSDVRLFVKQHNLFTYPDVMVVCGSPALFPGRQDTVTDANLIIEVLSPSTEGYDRGEFRFYRALPSLQQYVLVSQERMAVEQFPRRGPHEFILNDERITEGQVAFPSLGVELSIEQIYEGLSFTGR